MIFKFVILSLNSGAVLDLGVAGHLEKNEDCFPIY